MSPRPDLDTHQRDLLLRLVECDRKLTPAQRAGFYYSHLMGNPTPIIEFSDNHEDDMPISWGDMEVLRRAGLIITRSDNQSYGTIHVTPAASRLYEQLKRSHAETVQSVEATIQQFLESHTFRQRFGAAYETWRRAADLLWAGESVEHLSTIGHLCR